jgi:hypothetical protein
MDTIVSGSIEYLSVKWTDRRSQVSNLATLAPTFDVLDKDDVAKQTAVTCIVDGMVANCLIDTTSGGNWVSGIYRLYVRFTASPEIPLHGPFPFRVEVR